MPSHRSPGAHARDRRHDFAGAFALDALNERERRKFTRHLRRCPACAAEVRRFQEVAVSLAFAASADFGSVAVFARTRSSWPYASQNAPFRAIDIV